MTKKEKLATQLFLLARGMMPVPFVIEVVKPNLLVSINGAWNVFMAHELHVRRASPVPVTLVPGVK